MITASVWSLVLATVMGVTVSSGEFRHATATLTYLATPRRGRVLTAKAVADACAGARVMPVIEVHGLTKRFGKVLAVDQMSFEVEAGSVVGFLGSNGAGKTTTLRMLLGLIRPDAGTATINGRAYRDLEEPLHQVGAVLEASSFHPGRTARSHLRVQAMVGQADPSRIDDVLALVELTGAADRRVSGFSLGMRQRLGLAGYVIALGVGLTFVAARGYHVAIGDATLARYGLGHIVGTGLLAAIGVGPGSLIRSQLAGVIGVFVWTIVIESILGGLFTSIRPYLTCLIRRRRPCRAPRWAARRSGPLMV